MLYKEGFREVAQKYSGDLDKILKYYQELLKTKKESDDQKAIAFILNRIGKTFYKKGNYEEAMKNFKIALKIYENLGFLKQKAEVLINIGKVYKFEEDCDEALDYYLDALEIDEQLNNLSGKTRDINEIGLLFKFINEYDEALENFEKVLKELEEIDDLEIRASTLAYIGATLKDQGKNEGAFNYFYESLEIYKKFMNITKNAEEFYNNIKKLRDIKRLDYISNVFEISDIIEHPMRKTIYDINVYLKYIDLKTALEFYNLLFNESIHSERPSKSYSDLRNIGQALKAKSYYAQALEFLKKALEIIIEKGKSKEVDFRKGILQCPNPECNQELSIKLPGILNAIFEICSRCKTQFSIWMLNQNDSKGILNIISRSVSNKISSNINIELESKRGKESDTKMLDNIHNTIMIVKEIGVCFYRLKDYLNSARYFLQTANLYKQKEDKNSSKKYLDYVIKLLPGIDVKNRQLIEHEINHLSKVSPESLRKATPFHTFTSCPNCHRRYKVNIVDITIAILICPRCSAKFSVYFNKSTQEFYTNILEKPKIKALSHPDQKEGDLVKFCARCGLNLGIIVKYCIRCGLEIIRA
ncbi:MAG: tetratricopeptide repeat protein [Promethearchaeota archaeon]